MKDFIEFFKKNNLKFIIQKELLNSYKSAWDSKFIEIPSSLHYLIEKDEEKFQLQVENIIKSVNEMADKSTENVFAIIKDLFVPDTKLKTIIHKMLDKKFYNCINELFETLENFEFSSLDLNEFPSFTKIFELIDDSYMQVNVYTLKNYYLINADQYLSYIYSDDENEENIEHIEKSVKHFKTISEAIYTSILKFNRKNKYFKFYFNVPSELHFKLENSLIKNFEQLLKELISEDDQGVQYNNIFLPDYKFNTPIHLLLCNDKYEMLFELYNFMNEEKNKDCVEKWIKNEYISRSFEKIRKDLYFSNFKISKYYDLARVLNVNFQKILAKKDKQKYEENLNKIIDYFKSLLFQIYENFINQK